MLVIDSSYFLTSSHFICKEDGFHWSSEMPENYLYSHDFPELAEIMGIEIQPMIPESYTRSAKILNINPPWCFYIGKEKFLKIINSYSQSYFKFINSFDRENINIHIKIGSFLKSLKGCRYNPTNIDPELSSHFDRSIKDCLVDGFIEPPKYFRTKSKTGRLSVKSGPNVLNMHAGLRKGIVDGFSIDFISMEPNLLLALQNRSPKTNLYESIRFDVFENKISRAKVKIATMAALYGSNRSDKFAKKISEYFNLEVQVSALEKKVKNDTIRNEYGRLIHLNGARDRHLLSLWLQSSAADAALFGFYNFYNDNDIVPHWIIHDGLIFIYKGSKKEIKTLDVGLGIELPVKIEKL
tara:strand:+ start:47483 stop:48541 length:1059 start_codon:yes stop_codon:yes gene_type:complete